MNATVAVFFCEEEPSMDHRQEVQILGSQRISKLLFKFSIPCVMGLLISAFYNIIDQIFIGNSRLGYFGNAATGISFPVLCIANAFAWCIGDGAASYLSICAGRQDTERAHKCVGSGITATTCISIILAVVCLVFADRSCPPLAHPARRWTWPPIISGAWQPAFPFTC